MDDGFGLHDPLRTQFEESTMEVREEHKPLLKQLGLGEDDFVRFDGKFVRYEYDDKLGVRIYDPYYTTSYNEYIGIDGWSSWSGENDTFMSDVLKAAHQAVQGKPISGARPGEEEISAALQKKFGKHPGTGAK